MRCANYRFIYIYIIFYHSNVRLKNEKNIFRWRFFLLWFRQCKVSHRRDTITQTWYFKILKYWFFGSYKHSSLALEFLEMIYYDNFMSTLYDPIICTSQAIFLGDFFRSQKKYHVCVIHSITSAWYYHVCVIVSRRRELALTAMVAPTDPENAKVSSNKL